MKVVHKAASIPGLTNDDKERMFFMSINKYNANYNNEVREVEKNTGRNQHRYAAIAAAFALLVGGIGGSVALGKHIGNNSKTGTAFAEEITTMSEAEIETAAAATVSCVETTAAVDDRHEPADMNAFAQEWLEKYNEWLKIPNGAVEHEYESVSFKMAEGSYVPTMDAWKITDEEYCSADAINEHLHAFWAPGSKEDIVPAELTEKIDNGTVTYNDFLGDIYFTYNNELYRTTGNAGVEGRRTSPTAEKVNDNEILVHWDLGWEGVTVPQTMHLVWVDELNDWRVDNIFFEGE